MKRLLARSRRWLWLPLLVGSLALVIAGVAAGHYQTVQAWFEVICSSCIGLTF